MKRTYTGSILAIALTGYGTAVQAQESCSSDIDELRDQLENEQISASLEQRIKALLDQVEDSENCARLLMSSNERSDADGQAQARVQGRAQASSQEPNRPGAQGRAEVGGRAELEGRADQDRFGDDDRAAAAARAQAGQPARSAQVAQPAGQAARAGQASGAMVTRQATQLDDVVVVSASGEDIGEIDEIVRSSADGKHYGVLEIGGILGVGETEKLVALEDLEYDADENRLYISASQNVEQLPDFDEELYTELDGEMTVQVRSRAAGAGARIDTDTRRPFESGSADVGVSAEDLQSSFRQADGNGDGRLSESEAEMIDHLDFSSADTNGDGFITSIELINAGND
jgi:hypothetical protein